MNCSRRRLGVAGVLARAPGDAKERDLTRNSVSLRDKDRGQIRLTSEVRHPARIRARARVRGRVLIKDSLPVRNRVRAARAAALPVGRLELRITAGDFIRRSRFSWKPWIPIMTES